MIVIHRNKICRLLEEWMIWWRVRRKHHLLSWNRMWSIMVISRLSFKGCLLFRRVLLMLILLIVLPKLTLVSPWIRIRYLQKDPDRLSPSKMLSMSKSRRVCSIKSTNCSLILLNLPLSSPLFRSRVICRSTSQVFLTSGTLRLLLPKARGSVVTWWHWRTR